MSAQFPARRRTWPRVLAMIIVVAVMIALAAAVFVLSYSGLHVIALDAGVAPRWARFYPGILDAALAVACLAALTLRDGRWWARWYAWLAIIVMVAVGGGTSAIQAMKVALPHKQTAGVVFAAPWVLLLLAFSLWLTMLRQSRTHPGTPAPDAAPAQFQPPPVTPAPAPVQLAPPVVTPAPVPLTALDHPTTPDIPVVRDAEEPPAEDVPAQVPAEEIPAEEPPAAEAAPEEPGAVSPPEEPISEEPAPEELVEETTATAEPEPEPEPVLAAEEPAVPEAAPEDTAVPENAGAPEDSGVPEDDAVTEDSGGPADAGTVAGVAMPLPAPVRRVDYWDTEEDEDVAVAPVPKGEGPAADDVPEDEEQGSEPGSPEEAHPVPGEQLAQAPQLPFFSAPGLRRMGSASTMPEDDTDE